QPRAPEPQPQAEPAPFVARAPEPASPAPGFTVADFAEPPVVNMPAAPVAEDVPEPAAAMPDDAEVEALRSQLAALEARCDEQDAAIRRILGLLIQWVEQDEAEVRELHGRAA
ncbi:MAG: hypothetical protein K2X31_00095, partial [Sphingopyxis sp.]|nr:hypothetical protein [Sphingopyxis sp.]